MNTYIEIVELGRSGRVYFYTIRLNDAPHTEAEAFRMRFLDHPTFGSDYLEIANILKQISRRGAQQRYFRHERAAEALPPKWVRNARLRQYLLRLSDNVVILGNGCVKETRTAQESRDCNPKFQLMNKLSEKITHLCISGDLEITYTGLEGELEFYL